MASWEDDLGGVVAATQIIRSGEARGAREALADLAGFARVVQDLSGLHAWDQTERILDVLRLLDILQQASFYSRDPQSSIRSADQMRHRYFNVYGEFPRTDCVRLLNHLASANWVTVPKQGQITLTPVGRRLVGHLLRMVNEALEYHRLNRLEQGLMEIMRAEAYAEAFDQQGVDGADTLGQMVAGLVQLATDLEADLAMSVYQRSALKQVAAIKEHMKRVSDRVESAIANGDARHTPAQLRALAAEAAAAYAVAHRISYEAVGEVWRATGDPGQTPVRRINDGLFLDYLRQAAQAPKGGPGAILAFVDDGPDSSVPLLLPFRLQIPVGDDMLVRGLAAMAGAQPPAPRTPPKPVTYRKARPATDDELKRLRIDDGLDDFHAITVRMESYLGEKVDVSLGQMLAELGNGPLDAPVQLLALGGLLKTPKASLRVSGGAMPEAPWLVYRRFRVQEGRLLAEGPHAIRVRAGLALRRTVETNAALEGRGRDGG